MKLIDQWMCIDYGDFVGCLFVDFKKAFDVVDHSILFKKLINYKFKVQIYGLTYIISQ